MTVLFESTRFVVRELRRDELPALQQLYEANPDYFFTVGGLPPRPDEAQQEFDELPPAHIPFGTRWFAGVFDRKGVLKGLIIVVSDLSAREVWHTALFFVEVALRGTGAAGELQASLETWAAALGARWLRLGVVVGNRLAERFWSKCGYTPVRTRQILVADGETKATRVMVKPLAGGTLDEYLQRVPRDQPGSTLA
jgi:GNAT superfamily N-acetyltransferase